MKLGRSKAKVKPTLEGDRILRESVEELGKEDKDLLVRAALVIAKEADDPLLAKLEKINAKRMELKCEIVKRYEDQARERLQQITGDELSMNHVD